MLHVLLPSELFAGRLLLEVVIVILAHYRRVIVESIHILLDLGGIPVEELDLADCDRQVPPVNAVLLNQVLVELLLDLGGAEFIVLLGLLRLHVLVDYKFDPTLMLPVGLFVTLQLRPLHEIGVADSGGRIDPLGDFVIWQVVNLGAVM